MELYSSSTQEQIVEAIKRIRVNLWLNPRNDELYDHLKVLEAQLGEMSL